MARTGAAPHENEKDWLQASMSSETLQTMMGFLTTRDRFALLCTKKWLFEEPLATHFTSFCAACEDCEAKNQHLCKAKDNQQPESFWTTLLKHSCCGALKELHLASCDAFSANVLSQSPFAKDALAGLQVLDLNRCNTLGADGLLMLAEYCTNLRELHLRDMALDSKALEMFMTNNHKTLRVVDLLGCHTVKGDDVRSIALCEDLQDLSLWGCHNVDNKSLAHVVEKCSKINRLNLRYCHKVDDKLVAVVATALPKLKDLNLRYCYKISDKSIDVICDSLPQLENLNLSQCSRVTDAAILRIVASLRNLKELRLWGCTKLTLASVLATAAMPSLNLVDIRSRDKFEAVIGGPTALKFLIQTYRNTLAEWEQAGEVGVYKRPRVCAVAA
uniref:F-box/LRR-repeat protein 15-like leucin rich repeat domain-containing protein n=1 Tax=Globisporangium ultimum (strain ATCC 200006 / CBS 805.95 / DAOM BR144) TaxID=431595 RepID=K3WU90_GLOUD